MPEALWGLQLVGGASSLRYREELNPRQYHRARKRAEDAQRVEALPGCAGLRRFEEKAQAPAVWRSELVEEAEPYQLPDQCGDLSQMRKKLADNTPKKANRCACLRKPLATFRSKSKRTGKN